MARSDDYLRPIYAQIRKEIEAMKKDGKKLEPKKGEGIFDVIGAQYGYKKSWIRKIYYYSSK